jgi:formylglycine-generating enzyme required for sulfatase activity
MQPGQTFQDCADCPEMVVVPPGEFLMGWDGQTMEERYEGPERAVSIGYSFAVGQFEITNAQYGKFIEETDHVSAVDCYIWNGKVFATVAGTSWANPGYGHPPAVNDPAACVDWDDAKAFVTWLADKTGEPYRLLTEAEWEYAARAGREKTLYTWGDDEAAGCPYANIYDEAGASSDVLRPAGHVACNDGFVEVAPVGSLAPNPFGLYDMTGNVWEWVEDCYAMPYLSEPTDGSAQLTEGCDRRGVRGGSWSTHISWQRPEFRGRDPIDRISHIFGLRVARDL